MNPKFAMSDPLPSSPSPLFATVKELFDREGWSYREIPGREVIQAGFEAHHTRVELHVQAFPALHAVSVVSESALALPDPVRRERLAELILRTDQTLSVGAFEMDWDAGRVLFRVTNLFSTEAGDPAIIRGMVHTVILEMDRIAPLIVLISQAEGPALAGLNLPELMTRLDLLPGAGDS